MRYLSKHDLLDLHAYVLTRYGGKLGIKSQDLLTTVLLAPQQVMFETELYSDLAGKSAALLFSLLKARPFVSGNEVTALLALLRFLELNEAALDSEVSNGDLVWLVRGIGRAEIDKDALEAWLRTHLVEPTAHE